MRTCIISGRYPETEFKSYINHKAYADKYGYSYIHCNWPTKTTNVYLNKIVYVLSYLNNYDYVVWIDDDAFFFDFNIDIMNYAPKNKSFISLCKSPSFKELKTYFSSGQFIVKSCEISRSFFELVLSTELETVKRWWTEELGYFSNGDQDIMIYLLLNNDDYKGKMDLYDYKCFNSRWENIFEVDIHNPLVLHFTGKGYIKQINYLEAQKKLNLHPSLVCNSILKSYNIRLKNQYVFDEKKRKRPLILRLKRRINLWLKG